MSAFLRSLSAGAIGLMLLAVAPAAYAQSLPKNITLVVPFPAGGPTDLVARVVAQRLGQAIGSTIVVDNRPGANGLLGVQALLRAEKDGSVLLLNNSSIVMNLVMMKTAPYRLEDFVPISPVVESILALVIRPDLPINNVQEFLAYAKANPGKLTSAVIGTTGSFQFLVGTLRENANIDFVSVVYKGTADSLRDLLSGSIDMMFTDPINVMPLVKDGKLKMLATTSGTKVPTLDVPAFEDIGVHVEGGSIVAGLFAPAGTPPAITERLKQEVAKIIAAPDYQEKFGPVPAAALKDYEADMRKDYRVWSELKEKLKLDSQ